MCIIWSQPFNASRNGGNRFRFEVASVYIPVLLPIPIPRYPSPPLLIMHSISSLFSLYLLFLCDSASTGRTQYANFRFND